MEFKKLLAAMDRCTTHIEKARDALDEAKTAVHNESTEDFEIKIGHRYRIDFDNWGMTLQNTCDFGVILIWDWYEGSSSVMPQAHICYVAARISLDHVFFTAMLTGVRYSFGYDRACRNWECLDIYDPKS